MSRFEKPIIIMKKELMSYYTTPIAYIVISIFLVVTGWFFFSSFFLYNQAELRGFFKLLPIIFAFFIPAISMRLFSEEENTGTFEILMTLPVSIYDIVIGKLLASSVFVILMLFPTMIYAVSVAYVGDLDIGPVIGGYLGSVLLGCAFSSIGIFSSSLTRNQIIAFIISFTICISLSLIDAFKFFLPSYIIDVVQYLGVDYHFANISRGIIDSRDIIYFLSLIAIGVIGTVQIIEERR